MLKPLDRCDWRAARFTERAVLVMDKLRAGQQKAAIARDLGCSKQYVELVRIQLKRLER